MKKGLFGAVFTLTGVIVGGGVLGMPYVFSKVGFLTGLLLLLVMAMILTVCYLMIGEVLQRTKGKHHIVGLVDKYLGHRWKYFMGIITISGIYVALVGYSMAAGDILNSFFSWNPLYWSFIFIAVLSIPIYFSLKIMGYWESGISIIKILAALALGVYVLNFININNLIGFDISLILYPLGVVMFSLLGVNMVPVIHHELKDKKDLKKVIFISLSIAILMYIIFGGALVGVMGGLTPQVATVGLTSLGVPLFVLINLFGLLSVTTAFIGLGYALKEVYGLDFKIKHHLGWVFVVAVTVILVVVNPASFIRTLGICAAIAGGLGLSMIFYVHSKAIKKGQLKPTYQLGNLLWFKILAGILFIFIILNEVFGFFVL